MNLTAYNTFKCQALRLMSSSCFCSRWWNLPGYIQGLFSHGLEQPREAQTPQCRSQIVPCLNHISHDHAFHHTENMDHRFSPACRHTFLLATCHMFSHSSAGVDFRGDERSEQGILCVTRQSRTMWEHWSSLMRAAWGVFMWSRGKRHHSAKVS